MGDLNEMTLAFMRNADYDKALDCIENLWKEDMSKAKPLLNGFRKYMKSLIVKGIDVEENYELMHRSYLISARDIFDDFMTALEWYRPNDQKFWLPRRDKLMPVCEALQDFIDNKIDELFLSLPPRVGKSTIIRIFLLFWVCRDPKRSNLYCSFTKSVVDTFYNGMLEFMEDPLSYDLKTIFPEFSIVRTNALEGLIDCGRKKTYPSITVRSIDGTLNGSCDCDGLLIGDDLHSGIAEARSIDLLNKKWETVTNNFLARAKSGKVVKKLWIGTRWSLHDVMARRQEVLQTSKDCAWIRWKVINTPALDSSEESNFDYSFNKGFSTADYKAIRANFELTDDIASWLAQYIGQPIERDGAVFPPMEMRYFNGVLPEGIDPDRIYIPVDPAWGGGDFVAAPVCFQYGEDIFVPAVVYNNGDKSVTQPLLAQKAVEYNVQAMLIEGTKTTASYSEGIDKLLKERGYKINLQRTTKNWTGTGKEQRIYDKAPEIKSRMVFLDENHRDREYEQFMQNVFSFTVNGKNKHDDAPDACAMAVQFSAGYGSRATIMKRFW